MFKFNAIALLGTVIFVIPAFAQEQPSPEEMMKKMREHATPGEAHAVLGKLVGKWKTEMTVMGAPPTEGKAECKWILGELYIQQTFSGNMMGMPFEGLGLMGYDNYKKKYTSTWVDSMSTTKNDAEGMLDQTGKVLSFWGTMDEYLTGEHDKPVKYVFDMSQDDVMKFEIHDLAIGENSVVVSIKYTRDE